MTPAGPEMRTESPSKRQNGADSRIEKEACSWAEKRKLEPDQDLGSRTAAKFVFPLFKLSVYFPDLLARQLAASLEEQYYSIH